MCSYIKDFVLYILYIFVTVSEKFKSNQLIGMKGRNFKHLFLKFILK